MPPANSPTISRTSTPPINPYIRQLAEAISTPVADLASTLNLPALTNSFDEVPLHHRPAEDQDESHTPNTFLPTTHLGRDDFLQQPSMNPSQQSQPSTHQNYATVGGPPSRQSLYDWAMSRPEQSPAGLPTLSDESDDDDLDREIDRASTSAVNTDPEGRRDLLRLERALQNYRNARQALRSNRSGRLSDMGAVPTASALRAYWQEEPDADLSNSARPWLAPLGMSTQTRRRLAETRSQQPDPRDWASPKRPRTSDSFARVRNLIRYLSQLRHTGLEGGLALADELGLDSLYDSEGSHVPSDLPMHINSLPIPEDTSWLRPGMVWHGLQSTDREPVRNAAMLVSTARRERQREIFRRTLGRRRRLGWEPSPPAPEVLTAGELLDAERWLSSLRQNVNGRWGFIQPPPAVASSSPGRTGSASESDHWPVHVAIHSVDYDSMTLTGTMSASHIPDKSLSTHPVTAGQDRAESSMSSFFTGEIIDFRLQPLETESEGRDYTVGGLDVDARYWARLGPFQQEIQKVRSLRGKNKNDYQQDSRLWDAFRKAAGGDGDHKDSPSDMGWGNAPSMTTDASGPGADDTPGSTQCPEELEMDQEAEDDQIMARSLGSAKWIMEKLSKEWILMRWKERCFVSPCSGLPDAAPDATRRIVTANNSSDATRGSIDPSGNGDGSTSWGLTISGFYYVALNRMTGEIDGLYYDPGSQPYQALKMVPEGTVMRDRPAVTKVGSGRGEESSMEFGARCGCGEESCSDRVGLKRWFPSLEFR
ncbi:hypothetical protein B0A52_05290 [Exophiala mesophila]|uniref:Post-SET domain-containing protein n=1 Tax=Exophiala mesophila TaxID=212818 RepID=A0A438N503_EXOME|nr:hypothetical protein B0A52_05290 [Exophiala mesophila]